MNSPLPKNLMGECEKAAKILNHFITLGPNRGVDSIIPVNILQQAKGFAFLTVLKAGFVWSGRAGSGIVVAKLPDGSWSAPSAIGTAGAGFGAQIGAQVVDFLLILNTDAAVRAFTTNNVNLGANVSIAAGTMGRAAEAGGTASKTVASIFSYSKAKGLFAGISLEGSVVVQRNDANEKFYGRKVSAKELLEGRVTAPASAGVLYRALDDKIRPAFSSPSSNQENVSGNTLSRPRAWETNHAGSFKSYNSSHNANSYSNSLTSYNNQNPPPLPEDTKRPKAPSYTNIADSSSTPPPYGSVVSQLSSQFESPDSKTTLEPPTLPPRRTTPPSNDGFAVALYDFEPERPSDVGFLKNDRVKVLSKTGADEGWWYGEVNGLKGNFPSNYVQLL